MSNLNKQSKQSLDSYVNDQLDLITLIQEAEKIIAINRPNASQSEANLDVDCLRRVQSIRDELHSFLPPTTPPTETFNQTTEESIDDDDEDAVICVTPNIIVDLCSPIESNRPTRRRRNFIENEIIEIDDTFSEPQPKKRNDTVSPNISNNLDSNDYRENLIKCPICLDSLVGRQPLTTRCGHVFCKHCIKEALKLCKKCPVCKRSCNEKNCISLFF